MDQMNLEAWHARATDTAGCVSEQTAQALHATVGTGGAAPRAGDPLPPLWHWCAFPDFAPNDMLGDDGHPRGGTLLPPVRLPRRMWASGAVHLHAPLHVGDRLESRSSVRSVVEKTGASGEMIFVTLDHAIYGPAGLAIEEQQDIVYLHIPQTYTPPRKATMPDKLCESIETKETLLFRYSALTFNAHRIHYDRAYTIEVEKYPDLVVHGPLQATLLMRQAVETKGRVPRHFYFKGIHPMFALGGCDIAVEETQAALNLWTGQNGHQCMQATAIWEETQ